MKAVIVKEHLLRAISSVERASGDNLSLPILKNFLFEIKNGEIFLKATNLEIAISYKIPGKVISEGAAAIPIRAFAQLIKTIPSERIDIEKKDGSVVLKMDSGATTLHSAPVDDFPLIPSISKPLLTFSIKGSILKEAIASVVPAAQFSEIKPELSSVLLYYLSDVIKFVATDTFRLAEKSILNTQFSVKESKEGEGKFLIPLKTAHDLLRVLRDEDEVVLSCDQHQILFTTEYITFISRLIDGNFPEYESIIPTKFQFEVIMEKDELLNAVKTSSVLSGKSNEITFRFSKEKKAVEVHASDQIIGENTYLLPVKMNAVPPPLTFNWKYLLDGISVISASEVMLGINGDDKPVIIKAPKDTFHFYLLMPILKA
ncbi:DNA polymerase III subunit beta [Candidatus Parcubacteria bacterium]|nr:MAG: DNA polymerase III subunit beta [Candidatus Parcubacteria bacterium]